ncbi:sarcosine oxidase subunit gamma [Roseovarius rhodophyticola]|uniref:Sarcosine oxidase subunit gamma n=1 Tax=Roseovarius rhodophyticola TaxID=3080827 RepID=A0ABZ2TC88_9RHOB|nr:sarcosine oxidase subunit gamma [Roseovarius sp. W115]MDV2931049.1 sarcosine oxidase subunit gamma [Roseovarius sp. W115]
MVKLEPTTPLQGATPVEVGTMVVQEVGDLGPVTSIAPYPGRQKAVSDLLKKAHGITFPKPNMFLPGKEASCLWFGRDMALLIGAEPDPALAKEAALTDQSDAWAVLSLRGEGIEAALARLCPIDTRLRQFPINSTARTEVAHMTSSLTRMSETEFQLMIFRAFARTALHEITDAMEGVAARG